MRNDIINLYCDESHPIQNDGQDFLVIGAIACEKRNYKAIKDEIQRIKRENNLTLDYEFKWQYVSPKYINAYKQLIGFLANSEMISIKVNIAFGKRLLSFENFDGYNYEKWYHKMYYYMLNDFFMTHIKSPEERNISLYIDKKDSRSEDNYAKIARDLKKRISRKNNKVLFDSHSCDSKEFLLIQCIDVIIGSFSYFLKKAYVNKSKTELMKFIRNMYQISPRYGKRFESKNLSLYYWTPEIAK